MERSGAGAGVAEKRWSGARSGGSRSGNGAGSGNYRIMLERGAAFFCSAPLTCSGHRRDSAGWRSLRHSRSFKVLVPIENTRCDFLLVINTNLHPISQHRMHRLLYIAHYPSNIAFDSRCLSLANSFAETSENIARHHILLKSRFFELGLHYCRGQYGSTTTTIFNHFYVIGPTAAEFGKITQITAVKTFKVIQVKLVS